MSQISTLELAKYLDEHSIEQADKIAAERLTNLHYLVKDLAFALGVAVCYVEDAQHDENYKPDRVKKQLETMKSIIQKAEVENV
jgi:hypothetical protein